MEIAIILLGWPQKESGSLISSVMNKVTRFNYWHQFPTGLAKRLSRIVVRHDRDHRLSSDALCDEVKARARRGLSMDYRKHWVAFAKLYFVQNYWKCYRAAAKMPCRAAPRHRLRILDLGCGGGSSSAGVIAALTRRFDLPGIDILAIDSSMEQVTLYEKICLEWLREKSSISCTLKHRDAFALFDSDDSQWDLIIASYLFCEMRPEQHRNLLRQIHLRLSQRNGCAIIIRPDSNMPRTTVIEYAFPDSLQRFVPETAPDACFFQSNGFHHLISGAADTEFPSCSP